MSLLAVAVLGLLGTGVPVVETAEAGNYRQAQVTRTTHQVTRVQRNVQRPARNVRYSAPPRGSYLTRGRYWDPRVRWKNDPSCRCLFAVLRGDVWFLDPTSGWGYTVDRYGRVYTADPRYRAVYYVNNFGSWRGELPFFFGFFTPDDGYYALPRYRSYLSYWDSPRYNWYGYNDAYDFWWDTYPRYFRSNTFVSVVNFNFYDARYVNYDRHYRRDVYVDYRGNAYIAPQPATINGVPTGAPSGFARSQDLTLPVASEQVAANAPGPSQAVTLIDEMPKAPQVESVPAMPVNVAEAIASNPQFETAAPSMQQIDSFIPQQAQNETVVSAFDTPVVLEPSALPQETARADSIAQSPAEVSRAEVSRAEVSRDGVDSGDAFGERDKVNAAQFAEPEFPGQSAADSNNLGGATSVVSESARGDGSVQSIEPEPEFAQPDQNNQRYVEPSYSEPEQRYEEPSYSQPEQRYEEPSYSQPEQRYEEPSYAQPEPQYEAPSYSQPEQRYEEPQQRYEEAEQRYEEPSYAQPEEPSYSEPQESYDEPSYSEPEERNDGPSYSEPAPYEQPRYEEQSYSQTEPQYEAQNYQEPSYSQPEPQYEAPRYEQPSYSRSEPQYEAPSYEQPSYSEPAPRGNDYSSDEEGGPPRG